MNRGKSREASSWYNRKDKLKYGIEIVVDKDLNNNVMQVKSVGDRL